MIHIVADSTVYRADPRREKAAFKALARLTQGKHVTLHIPEIVRREFLSQEEELHNKNAKMIQDSLHNLGKRPMDAIGVDHLKKIADASADLAKTLKDAAAKEFDAWVKSIFAKEHPIAPSHGVQAMDAYFAGTPPFKEKKNRKDIPDSFVWQVIQELSKTHKPLYVISGDGGVGDQLKGNKDFVVFALLEELIASTPIQALVQQHNVNANLMSMLALLPGQTAFIEGAIENPLIDELHGKTVGDDESEPSISGVGQPKDLEVDVDEAVDHGNGIAVIPFRLKVECMVEFGIDKSDYYLMDEEEAEGVGITELNDHRFLAEEDRMVRVEGNLSIQVDATKLQAEKIAAEALVEILKNGDFKIDSIEEMEFEDKSVVQR